MSNLTIATLPRITPQQLRTLLKSPTAAESLAIIDVRDSDHLGGHIATSRHVPTSTHDTALPELARALSGKEMVVFHCMLSQQRGPSAALRYARERERVLRGAPGGGGVTTVGVGKVDGKGLGEGLGEGVQRVCVLQGGFEGWVRAGFGEDEEVTEGFVKDLWEGELDW